MTRPLKPRLGPGVLEALEQRVLRTGSAPLLTWYDLDRDERTELSGRTFANWVDKSANLLVSMDVDDVPRVANTVLITHPGHWVGLVWTMAIWQLGGCVVAVPRERLASTDLLDAAVVGPDDPHPVPGVETVACSLHPLGAPFEHKPLGVTDYAEVLSQPDVHWRAPAEQTVCFETDLGHSWAELGQVEPSGERRLLCAGASPWRADPWRTVVDALVAPLLGQGSVVLYAGGTDDQIDRIADQERATRHSP